MKALDEGLGLKNWLRDSRGGGLEMRDHERFVL